MAELNGHLAGSDDRTELAEKPDSVWLDPMTGEPSVEEDDDVTLLRVLGRIYDGIFISDGAGSLSRRFRSSLSENFPRLRRACKNSGSELLLWARRGSPLRALLVISVGTISLISLSGLAMFVLFFMVATLNAIIISLLMSLAAVGWFLALFLSFLVTVYIGALFVAAFIISFITISTITVAFITAGWVGLTWAVYLIAKKGMEIVKQLLAMAVSMVPASSTRESQHHVPKED